MADLEAVLGMIRELLRRVRGRRRAIDGILGT